MRLTSMLGRLVQSSAVSLAAMAVALFAFAGVAVAQNGTVQPPPSCDGSFSAQNVRFDGENITFRLVGVDLARFLGRESGLLFVSPRGGSSEATETFNASPNGVNIPITIHDAVSGRDYTLLLSLTNAENTLTHCSDSLTVRG